METNVNYTLVGGFVIILLTVIVLGIIWLSSGFSFERYATYAVYMQESVTGLNIDSPVEYNGVNVGSVRSIELNQKNPRLVEVLLKIKGDTPVTVGTVATINSKGITGIAYVALKDVGHDLQPLSIKPGETYPVIQTAPSLFLRLDTALGELSGDFRKISDSIQTLLDNENQRSIKETLSNLEKITNTLAINSQKFNMILENTSKASQQFMPLLTNLDEMTRNLAGVSADMKQNPSILIRGIDNQPRLGPGETK